jgi:hypothetical protein
MMNKRIHEERYIPCPHEGYNLEVGEYYPLCGRPAIEYEDKEGKYLMCDSGHVVILEEKKGN